MSNKTIVIVGGALSGPTAAAKAREWDEDARIVLLERGADVSYALGGLAYHLSGEVPSLQALNRERAEIFRDVYRIEVRLKTAITHIDAAARTVQLNGEKLTYDSLIYSAGAASIIPAIPGLQDAGNVVAFRTLRDLEAIRRLLKNTKQVAILGGGFIGVEAADGFSRRKCKVTLLEMEPQILPRFSASISRMAQDAMAKAGVRFVTGVQVLEAKRKAEQVHSLRLSDGSTIPAGLVVVAAGLRPRTELLREAGAALHPDGTVVVDESCATSLPGIFACGVCISLPHAVSGKPVWLAQAALADKSAQVAGASAAGGAAKIGPILGTAIIRAGELTLARTGLTREEAAATVPGALGSIRIYAPSQDAFFPGSVPTTVELLYDQVSGKILGAEVAAAGGADKRIDVLATAIAGGLNVEQLAALDLAYAPPYSAARDPVNVAGAVASAACRGLAAPWSAAQLAAEREQVAVVDVRPAPVASVGTIENALHLPQAVLRARINELPAGRTLVFVCETGRSSYLAARLAKQRGLDAAYLSGGLRSWRAEGRTLAKGRAGSGATPKQKRRPAHSASKKTKGGRR